MSESVVMLKILEELSGNKLENFGLSVSISIDEVWEILLFAGSAVPIWQLSERSHTFCD